MKPLFVQENNKNNPFHEFTLEGTPAFPIYLVGYVDDFNGLDPVAVTTYAFMQDEDLSVESLFGRFAKRKPKNEFSILLHAEDAKDSHLFRRCRFIKEIVREKIYSLGEEILFPFIGLIPNKPTRIKVDMFWEVL